MILHADGFLDISNSAYGHTTLGKRYFDEQMMERAEITTDTVWEDYYEEDLEEEGSD